VALERTTVHLDQVEVQEAVKKAKKEHPALSLRISDIIRALIKKYISGEVKL
jgi:hypothetical protein